MGFLSRFGGRLDMMQAMFVQTGAMDADGMLSASPSSLRQASARCLTCSETEACRKWLDTGFEKELENREPPQFCPNQDTQKRMILGKSR